MTLIIGYGWGLKNRHYLLQTAEQVKTSLAVAKSILKIIREK